MKEGIYQFGIIVDGSGEYQPILTLGPEAEITPEEKLNEGCHLLFLADYASSPVQGTEKNDEFEKYLKELSAGVHRRALTYEQKEYFEKKLFHDSDNVQHYPEDVKNLLLSEVQEFDFKDFTRCRVHYDGIAGKGRDWEYEAGGEPFETIIDMQEAFALSIAQEYLQGRGCPEEAQQKLIPLVDAPEELAKYYHGDIGVTGNAQVALYDLLTE